MILKSKRERARAFRQIAYSLAGKPVGQPRQCAKCGAEFIPITDNQRFCNIRCSAAYHQSARRKRRYAELWAADHNHTESNDGT